MKVEAKKKLDIYLSLSTELYELNKTKVSENEFAFYLGYAKEARGVILEPMCGSGRFLIPLLEAGFKVDGFDASLFMIDALYQKINAKNLQSRIWQCFLQDLSSPERYKLVFIPDASFNLILDINEVKICLHKIYEHLEKSGRFVFELVTRKYAGQIRVGAANSFIVVRPDGKHITQQVQVLPFDGQIASTSCHYQLHDNGDILKTELEILKLFLHEPDEIEHYLEEIGFRSIKRLKAFDNTKTAEENDSVIIFDCTK